MGVGGREGRERDGEGLAQSESEDGSERHTHSEYHTASTTQRYAPHPTTTTHAATTTWLCCPPPYLPPAPFPVRRPLDDPRKVQQLDLAPLVVQVPRNGRERGELVPGGLGLGVRQLGEEGGLANAGEADERHAPVP